MRNTDTRDRTVQSEPEPARAIDRWLAARKNAKAVPTEGNRHAYNATYYALGGAWAHRYPEAANTPGAFEWYLRGLAASETDE